MKSELITEPKPVQPEIDWNKPMVLITDDGHEIVLSSGKHDPVSFSGQKIGGTEIYNSVGLYAESWGEKFFNPCTDPVTIKFTND